MGKPIALDFSQRLEIGKEFECIVSKFLIEQGFPLGLYLSANKQWEFGESASHTEIKFDRVCAKTGNLFIEVSERRDDSGNSKWRDAGIHDASSPWFYLIGDHHALWFLSVRWLQLMFLTGKYPVRETTTAKGFLVSTQVADKIAIRKWEDWL